MRGIKTHAFVLAVMAFLAMPTRAPAGEYPLAAKLSAALGGSLGHGMSEAGSAGHGRFVGGVELRPGRNEAFRKQVFESNRQERVAKAR